MLLLGLIRIFSVREEIKIQKEIRKKIYNINLELEL